MPAIDRKSSRLPLLLAAGLMASIPALAQQAGKPEPLVIQDQGSFTVGGTVTTAPTHHLAPLVCTRGWGFAQAAS
jgi:hypothetical protein